MTRPSPSRAGHAAEPGRPNTPATTLARPTTVPSNQTTVTACNASSVFDRCGRLLASAASRLSEFAERSKRATWRCPDRWEPPGSARHKRRPHGHRPFGSRRTIGGTRERRQERGRPDEVPRADVRPAHRASHDESGGQEQSALECDLDQHD